MLTASAGKAIYLSSIAGQLTPTWPGFGVCQQGGGDIPVSDSRG